MRAALCEVGLLLFFFFFSLKSREEESAFPGINREAPGGDPVKIQHPR